jgi:hypothetical protein
MMSRNIIIVLMYHRHKRFTYFFRFLVVFDCTSGLERIRLYKSATPTAEILYRRSNTGEEQVQCFDIANSGPVCNSLHKTQLCDLYSGDTARLCDNSTVQFSFRS